MKKIVLVFCALAMLACGKKTPECDAVEITNLLIEKYWSEMNVVMGDEATNVLKNLMQISIKDAETVESDAINKVCKATLVSEVIDEEAKAKMQAIGQELSSSGAIDYTVALNENKEVVVTLTSM